MVEKIGIGGLYLQHMMPIFEHLRKRGLRPIIWADIAVYYWIVLLAFDQTQPFVAGLAVSSVTALGMTVPSSPGYIGVFEGLARATMEGLFGMGKETALGYALVAHAIVYVALTLLGLAGMAQQNLTYSEIQKRISTEDSTPS